MNATERMDFTRDFPRPQRAGAQSGRLMRGCWGQP